MSRQAAARHPDLPTSGDFMWTVERAEQPEKALGRVAPYRSV